MKDELEKGKLLFQNEVDRFETRFRRGRLLTDGMLSVVDEREGEQPLTLRERQRISRAEKEMLQNYDRAVSLKRDGLKRHGTEIIRGLVETLSR